MKTNVTVNARQSNVNASEWLHENNSFLSELLECRISNASFIGAMAFAICAVMCIVLASDWCKFYGWSAFFGLLALNCVIGLFREFNKGGK